jgi:PST family polysaccharide transporter
MTVMPAMSVFCLSVLVAILLVHGADEQLAVIGGMLTVPAGALAQIQTAVHQRDLDFRQIALASLAGTLASVLASLLLAIAGSSVLALVARLNLTSVVMALILMVRNDSFVRRGFDRKVARQIAGYARGLVGYNALNQLARNGDNLLIGSFLGSTPLGLYSLAYRFITFPLAQVGQLAQNVLFPTLAHVTDRVEFDRTYLRSSRLLLWLIAPVGVCAIVVGDLATVSFLGERWRGAGPIVRIFGLVAIVQALDTHSGLLFMLRQRTNLFFRWSVIWGPVAVVSFVAGLPWGIKGVAWAYLAANLLVLYPYWRLVLSLVDFKAADVMRTLSIEVAVASILVAIGLLARSAIDLRGALAVAATGLALTVTYWLGCLWLDRALRSDLSSLIPRRTR